MKVREKINVELQRQIDMQNSRIDKIDVKLDAFIQEMRDKDKERADEIKSIRAEMLAKDNQRTAEMAEIRTTLQNMYTSGRNLNIVTLLGIAAIVVAVLLK